MVRGKQVFRVFKPVEVTHFAGSSVPGCFILVVAGGDCQVFQDVKFPVIFSKCHDFIKTVRNTNRPVHVRWFRTGLHNDYVPVGLSAY